MNSSTIIIIVIVSIIVIFQAYIVLNRTSMGKNITYLSIINSVVLIGAILFLIFFKTQSQKSSGIPVPGTPGVTPGVPSVTPGMGPSTGTSPTGVPSTGTSPTGGTPFAGTSPTGGTHTSLRPVRDFNSDWPHVENYYLDQNWRSEDSNYPDDFSNKYRFDESNYAAVRRGTSFRLFSSKGEGMDQIEIKINQNPDGYTDLDLEDKPRRSLKIFDIGITRDTNRSSKDFAVFNISKNSAVGTVDINIGDSSFKIFVIFNPYLKGSPVFMEDKDRTEYVEKESMYAYTGSPIVMNLNQFDGGGLQGIMQVLERSRIMMYYFSEGYETAPGVPYEQSDPVHVSRYFSCAGNSVVGAGNWENEQISRANVVQNTYKWSSSDGLDENIDHDPTEYNWGRGDIPIDDVDPNKMYKMSYIEQFGNDIDHDKGARRIGNSDVSNVPGSVIIYYMKKYLPQWQMMHRPGYWNDGSEILNEFRKWGMVGNLQCWVFSLLLNTMCRGIGIPCRNLTNMGSAHKTCIEMDNLTGYQEDDSSIQFGSEGAKGSICDTSVNANFGTHWFNAVDKDGWTIGPMIGEYDDSMIWNFHAWNDAWMNRPDLVHIENGRYADYGWQAIDATPQESSGGFQRMGPAPLLAVKEGYNLTDLGAGFDKNNAGIGYDSSFVFNEVNYKSGFCWPNDNLNKTEQGYFNAFKSVDGNTYVPPINSNFDLSKNFGYGKICQPGKDHSQNGYTKTSNPHAEVTQAAVNEIWRLSGNRMSIQEQYELEKGIIQSADEWYKPYTFQHMIPYHSIDYTPQKQGMKAVTGVAFLGNKLDLVLKLFFFKSRTDGY